MTRFSEFGEDTWIMRNCFVAPNGLYVDIGCMTPNAYSNTAFLRDLGWHGLAIDANDYSEAWISETKAKFVQATVSDCCKEVAMAGSGPCSHVTQGHGTITTSIDALLLLLDNRPIDLLSIDVEGEEFNVLSQMDLKIYRPPIIISEYVTQTDQGIVKDFRVMELLLNNGYRASKITPANIIYELR